MPATGLELLAGGGCRAHQEHRDTSAGLRSNLLINGEQRESAPTSMWDTKPTESHARSCLRDVGWASLALPAWAVMRLLRLVLSLLGVSEHRWKGVPNDTVLSAADAQRLLNVVEALEAGSLDKQALLQLPPPDHYSCSSSSQAVALVLHHLYNVITALEIVVAQQGVSLGSSELAAIYSRLVKPLRKALIQSKLGGVNHQDVLKDLRHAGKGYLVHVCREVQHVKLRSKDLVQAYFFECLMLQSLGVGSVQTRELLRSELTQLKRIGSSVGCELRAFGCSMFSSSRSSTESRAALDHTASSLGKKGRRALCGKGGGSNKDGGAYSNDLADDREEKRHTQKEDGGAHQTLQVVPGFLGAATAAAAFDTAADAAMEATVCTLGKLGSGEMVACTLDRAGSTRSTSGHDDEVLQEKQEPQAVAAEAEHAHTPQSSALVGALAQAFTYAEGDLLLSQPAMLSKAQGLPAPASKTETASRLSHQPLLQSGGECRHIAPSQDPSAGQSPFTIGSRENRMSHAPSAPFALPPSTARPTSAAVCTAQAFSLPAAFPDAALNPGPWHQPRLAMPSPQPTRPPVLTSNPSRLRSHTTVHSPTTTHHQHAPTQVTALPSAHSTRTSLSSDDFPHPTFPCPPPIRTASIRSSRSTCVSLSASCLPKCRSIKAADGSPDAPVRVVEMCRLINLSPGVDFLEAQGSDSFADHVKYMKSRGNVRPSGAKNEWLVQAMSINARMHTLMISKQDGSDVQMPTYARSGAFAVHGRKPRAMGLSALLAARDAAAAAGTAAASAAGVACRTDSTTRTPARDSSATSSDSTTGPLRSKMRELSSPLGANSSAISDMRQPSCGCGGGAVKGAVGRDSEDSVSWSSSGSTQGHVLKRLKQVGYSSQETLDAEIHIRSVCCIAQALPVVVSMLQQACASPSCLAAALESGAWLYVQQSLLSDRQETEGAYLQDTEGALALLSQRAVVRFVDGTPQQTVLVDPNTGAITILLDVGLVPDAVLQCTTFPNISRTEPPGQHAGVDSTTLESRLALSNASSTFDNPSMSTGSVQRSNSPEKKLLLRMQQQQQQHLQQEQQPLLQEKRQQPLQQEEQPLLQEEQQQRLPLEQPPSQEQQQHPLQQEQQLCQTQQQRLQQGQQEQQQLLQEQQQHCHFEHRAGAEASRFRPSINPLFHENPPEASAEDSHLLQLAQIFEGLSAHAPQQLQDPQQGSRHRASAEGEEEAASSATHPLLQGNCSRPIPCRSASPHRSKFRVGRGFSQSLSWLKPHRRAVSPCSPCSTSSTHSGKQVRGRGSSQLFSCSAGCEASLGKDRSGSGLRNSAAGDKGTEARRRGCNTKYSSLKASSSNGDGGSSDDGDSGINSSARRARSVACASGFDMASSEPSRGSMGSALPHCHHHHHHHQQNHYASSSLLTTGEPRQLDSAALGDHVCHQSSRQNSSPLHGSGTASPAQHEIRLDSAALGGHAHHQSSHQNGSPLHGLGAASPAQPDSSNTKHESQYCASWPAADGSVGVAHVTRSLHCSQDRMCQLSTASGPLSPLRSPPWGPLSPLGSPKGASASFITPPPPASTSCLSQVPPTPASFSAPSPTASCLLPFPPFAAANWPTSSLHATSDSGAQTCTPLEHSGLPCVCAEHSSTLRCASLEDSKLQRACLERGELQCSCAGHSKLQCTCAEHSSTLQCATLEQSKLQCACSEQGKLQRTCAGHSTLQCACLKQGTPHCPISGHSVLLHGIPACDSLEHGRLACAAEARVPHPMIAPSKNRRPIAQALLQQQSSSTFFPVSCPLLFKLKDDPLADTDQPSRRGSLPSKPPPVAACREDSQPGWQTSSSCSMVPSSSLITKTSSLRSTRSSIVPHIELRLWPSSPTFQPSSTHHPTKDPYSVVPPTPSPQFNSCNLGAPLALKPTPPASMHADTLHQSSPLWLAHTQRDFLSGPQAITTTTPVPLSASSTPLHVHTPSPFALNPSAASTHQPQDQSVTWRFLPCLDATMTTTNTATNNPSTPNTNTTHYPHARDNTLVANPSATPQSWPTDAALTSTHPSNLPSMLPSTPLGPKAELIWERKGAAGADTGACFGATKNLSWAPPDCEKERRSDPTALPSDSGIGGKGVDAAGGDAGHFCNPVVTANRRKRQMLLERTFRLHTCLFNQGINIMQSLGTLKLRLKNKPPLQERVNLEGLQRLNPYAACAGRSDGPALRELNHHYGPAGIRAVKDVHAISLVRRAVAELGGVRAVNCKSGKDRTALELAQSLSQDAVEAGQLSSSLQAALVRDLQAGLSYMQTGENNGQPSAYAFSETELMCLPPGWSPKWQLCGKVMS